jgi:hypothetical protein
VQVVNVGIGGALPAPLTIGTEYYVKTANAGTYTLSLTQGGAAIDLTTAGTGLQFMGPRVFAIDQPPRNLAEANREIELICSEGLRRE